MHMPRPLTDEQHDRLNRLRNNVNVWLGFGMIVLLAFLSFVSLAAGALKLATWILGQ